MLEKDAGVGGRREVEPIEREGLTGVAGRRLKMWEGVREWGSGWMY